MGLRVEPRIEYYGLDLALHGETIVEYRRHLPKKGMVKSAQAKSAETKNK